MVGFKATIPPSEVSIFTAVTIQEQLYALTASARKGVAILLDPDKIQVAELPGLLAKIEGQGADFIFVGGSLITTGEYEERVQALRRSTKLPLVLFPGSPSQLTPSVDAVLFLSLVSGRNPELLIGHHVTAAPRIRELQIEALATGYLLIDGGRPTTASYISNTLPIPANKVGIAVATSMAAEMLGMKAIYLDTGSGADRVVPVEMIQAVREAVQIPIIVGGGIRTPEARDAAHRAGADLVVIGTAIEENPELIADLI